jgi:hypothetical protein
LDYYLAHRRRIRDFEDFTPHTRVTRRHGRGVNAQVKELAVDPGAAGEFQEGIDTGSRRTIEPRTQGAVEKHLFGHWGAVKLKSKNWNLKSEVVRAIQDYRFQIIDCSF